MGQKISSMVSVVGGGPTDLVLVVELPGTVDVMVDSRVLVTDEVIDDVTDEVTVEVTVEGVLGADPRET